MLRGSHELLRLSQAPAMPNPSKPCSGGRLQGERPAAISFPPLDTPRRPPLRKDEKREKSNKNTIKTLQRQQGSILNASETDEKTQFAWKPFHDNKSSNMVVETRQELHKNRTLKPMSSIIQNDFKTNSVNAFVELVSNAGFQTQVRSGKKSRKFGENRKKFKFGKVERRGAMIRSCRGVGGDRQARTGRGIQGG
jgi:hypothetical protein